MAKFTQRCAVKGLRCRFSEDAASGWSAGLCRRVDDARDGELAPERLDHGGGHRGDDIRRGLRRGAQKRIGGRFISDGVRSGLGAAGGDPERGKESANAHNVARRARIGRNEQPLGAEMPSERGVGAWLLILGHHG